MTANGLSELAELLVAQNKGLLAIDESTGTCNRRLAAVGIPQTAEMRRTWRELLMTTPDLGRSISGVILYDETIKQTTSGGLPFVDVLKEAGIIPGIKVDIGTTDMARHAGEKITEGLDGLGARLDVYAWMGARFAKWRGVLSIGDTTPSRACVEANAQSLARYATLCQQAGLVPVVEPEVLMTGNHDLAKCADVTEAVLHAVFRHAYEQGVILEGMLLKPNMVLAGVGCPTQPGIDEVVATTLSVLLRAVPAAVPGIAFLSGGQPAELATARLAAMNEQLRGPMPWQLTFSFGRAIQQSALNLWRGQTEQAVAAQAAIAQRADSNRAARAHTYDASTDLRMFAADVREAGRPH